MTSLKKFAVLLGAGVLMFATFGTALAATGASDQGVVPTEHSGNITLAGNGNDVGADCAAADGIETGDSAGSDTTDNGVTVTWTYDGTTKAFGFTATGGLVTIAYVKGSSSYNEYDYTGLLGGGVASDGNMFAPDNASGGPAGLSHAVFCTTPGESQSQPPSEAPSQPPSQPPSEAPSQPPSQPPSEGPSFGISFADITEAPSEPSTDSLGANGTSAPGDGAWLLVVALGVLLASIVVLTPARAKSRR